MTSQIGHLHISRHDRPILRHLTLDSLHANSLHPHLGVLKHLWILSHHLLHLGLRWLTLRMDLHLMLHLLLAWLSLLLSCDNAGLRATRARLELHQSMLTM